MKKNSLNDLLCHFRCNRQILLYMKAITFLMFLAIVNITAGSYAQETKLNLSMKDASLKEIFDKIEEQSEFTIFYKNNHVNDDVDMDVSINNRNIKETLSEVLRDTKLKYEVKDKVVIVLPDVSGVEKNKTPVKGRVTDPNGASLPGVSVLEKGTNNIVTTDVDGIYSIGVSNPNAVLVFSFVGMKDKEVQVSSRSRVDVVLSGSEMLQEVVVTALGMKREKKALGYAMQEIKAEELNTTMNPTINGALEGKISGVMINSSGGGVGSSSKITIRGNSSISRSNEPLWIIDGIPLNDEQKGTANEWSGRDMAGSAQDINPEDIESISVLKGPNASALYGSRATNGVILITTKKGHKTKGIGVSYNSSMVWEKPYDLYEYQTKYAQGLNGVFDSNSKYSWGPEIKGQEVPSWRYPGETYKLEDQSDRVSKFYKTGVSQSHNLAFVYGNDKISSRFTIGHNKDEGIYEKLLLKKYNFSGRFNIKMNKYIDIDSKVTYIRSSGRNRAETGIYGCYMGYTAIPITIRDEDLNPPFDEKGNLVHFIPQSPDDKNPYFLQHQRNNYDIKHRFIGHFSVNVNFTDKLKLNLKHGLDFYNHMANNKQMEDPTAGNNGYYSENSLTFIEENSSALLSYNDKIDDFTFGISLGANRMNYKKNRISGNSGKLLIPDNYFLANGSEKDVSSSLTEKEIHSVYGLLNVGYKDYLFLDITGRNDWSSTLPENNWSYFYPSATVSAIISEVIEVPAWLSFLKARAGYSMVGNDTDPYKLENTMSLQSKYKQITYAKLPSNKALSDLKPEETKSFEFGLDAKFFNNRLGVDFTYYDSKTENQIIGIEVPSSSGFSKELINAGEISNSGIELMLYATPIKWNGLQWDVTLNWSKNENKVEELHDRLKEYSLGGTNIASVWAIEGSELGDIRGNTYLRNDEGKIIVNDSGLPKTNQEKQVIGNINPDWYGSVRSDLYWNNFSFSVLMNIKQGGDIISNMEANLAQVGNAKITEDRRDFVFPGVKEDGSENKTTVNTEQFYKYVGGRNGIAEEFLYDASYIKVQEIAIGYKLPKKICEKIKYIQSLKFSIVGRNLGYLVKDVPGSPEGFYTRSVAAQAVDYAGVPASRSFGFNLSVQF